MRFKSSSINRLAFKYELALYYTIFFFILSTFLYFLLYVKFINKIHF